MATKAKDPHPVQNNTEDHVNAVNKQILATIYGQCIGDAIGLLTEFFTKEDAQKAYGKNPKNLHYGQKVSDRFRDCWDTGDWTDDTDQMILIMQSLLYNKGEINQPDFGKRLKRWMAKGFPELGDQCGRGLGRTTKAVLTHPDYETKPEWVAKFVWEANQCKIAPNGGVMRTSIMGLHNYDDEKEVVRGALSMCKVSHYDPRCQASVVAVSVAISQMIQHTKNSFESGKKAKKLDVKALIKYCYEEASKVLETDELKAELWKHMSAKKLKDLNLGELGKIGYTFKCMGSGFWALKQDNFKKALIELVMEGGDADTNGCVAASLLACKLGLDSIPTEWIDGLKHKDFIDDYYHKFLKLQQEMGQEVSTRTSYPELCLDDKSDDVNGSEREGHEGMEDNGDNKAESEDKTKDGEERM